MIFIDVTELEKIYKILVKQSDYTKEIEREFYNNKAPLWEVVKENDLLYSKYLDACYYLRRTLAGVSLKFDFDEQYEKEYYKFKHEFFPKFAYNISSSFEKWMFDFTFEFNRFLYEYISPCEVVKNDRS